MILKFLEYISYIKIKKIWALLWVPAWNKVYSPQRRPPHLAENQGKIDSSSTNNKNAGEKFRFSQWEDEEEETWYVVLIFIWSTGRKSLKGASKFRNWISSAPAGFSDKYPWLLFQSIVLRSLTEQRPLLVSMICSLWFIKITSSFHISYLFCKFYKTPEKQC